MNENPETSIGRMSIPDDAVAGWIKTFQEGDFTQEQIDLILAGLNEKYLNEHFSAVLDEEIEMIEKDAMERLTLGGVSELTDIQRKIFREIAKKKVLQWLTWAADHTDEDTY